MPEDFSKAKTSYLPEVPDPLLGRMIAGRYQIKKKLGEGGMGSVYLAMHSVLEKEVALKVLHGEFARKPELVERFMQEAKAASRIRHENVIDISDFGVTEEGYVFFAMELLSGHDLHEEIARARRLGEQLPWARTKKIFLQISAALSAAHVRGVIHRDLKPENVYLVQFLDDPDFVKLLDFGIAKLTDVSSEPGARKLTKTGMLFGTPEYMSPEQARGENVDHRVDIYAMGCILYQLVTGGVPFESDNFMAVLSQHLTEAPPQIPPMMFDRIGAPRTLAAVIAKALVKDRNQRYQTIDDFANAVRQVSGEAAVAPRARPATAPQPILREQSNRVRTQWKGELKVPEIAVEEPKRRSKLPLIIGALVLLGGVAAAIVVLQGRDKAEQVAVKPAPLPPVTPAPAPPPPPPKEEPLPATVEVTVESNPNGAAVIDGETNKKLGATPYHFVLPGSKTARAYKLQMKGYDESTVEIVPLQPRVQVTQTLQKSAAKTAKPAVKKPDAPADDVPKDLKKFRRPDEDTPEDEPTLKPMPK